MTCRPSHQLVGPLQHPPTPGGASPPPDLTQTPLLSAAVGTALGEVRARDPHPSPRMPGVQVFPLRPTYSKALMGQAGQVGAYVLCGCVEAVPRKRALGETGHPGRTPDLR